MVKNSEPWKLSPALSSSTFLPERSWRFWSIKALRRATPPKHSFLPSSSAEQVESNLLIDSMREWRSLICRMFNS
ncbi:hypothetical protein D3C87_2155340 [compost metagenome]